MVSRPKLSGGGGVRVASWNAGEESAYGGAAAAGEVGGEAVTGSITPGTAAGAPIG